MSTAFSWTPLDSTEVILYNESITAVVNILSSSVIAGYLNQNVYSNHCAINTFSCIVLLFNRILFL